MPTPVAVVSRPIITPLLWAEAEIEKLASPISKKILPTASTLIRACVVVVAGTVKLNDPLFGALAAITVGNVWPPSVESEIFTFATFTGLAFVLFTAQVIA